MEYRKDIDGLRAIAVIAVVLFHLKIMSNGYLGVDVFFVISGFLITKIIYRKAVEREFSIINFYVRRIRRIIPLLLTVTTSAIVIGVFLMLPDDLENLAQSVIASNMSLNNVLMFITSFDYWAIKNDYKPLMHTWSLGIEEQFYIIYPFFVFYLSKLKAQYFKWFLTFITIVSLAIFLQSQDFSAKFYFLQYRFFELSIGGLSAVLFDFSNTKSKSLKFTLYFSLALLISTLFIPLLTNDIKILVVTFLTSLILILGSGINNTDKLYKTFLSNKIMVFIGKISFSLYMWHHLLFAFARYAYVDEIKMVEAIVLCCLTLILSVITYYFLEVPFRDFKKISTKRVLLILSVLFLISNSTSFYIYYVGGIIKDFPSLNQFKAEDVTQGTLFSGKTNIQRKYNEDVRNLDKDFEDTNKKKILVLGNSYGRDVVNIFKESGVNDNVELRYFDIEKLFEDDSFKERFEHADIFILAAFNFIGKEFIEKIEKHYSVKINRNKFWVFGTKDFGCSNGIHYNKLSRISDFKSYRTDMKDGFWETNLRLKQEWGSRYVDLVEVVSDEQGRVIVFSLDGKFLSQDTSHFTKVGAKYFASKMEDKLVEIISE